ncbi:MAG TPA: MOSC domain-containing protein [Rhodobacteraceae bacterium]|nr:MOSC domain-containing protein [Paracoccaceae bacterium]HBV55407.1 MOSC domain-containing protein [Paracoccaceae bacterium]
MSSGKVVAVARDDAHRFSKELVSEIRIVEGLGVEGDAHLGRTVKHRSRVAADPSQPNLRHVHLIHSELFSEVGNRGFVVHPADLGENITTIGVDLLALPKGTVLKIGQTVELEVTGLRNPCSQIDDFQSGLLSAVLMKGENGELIRKSGIMAIAKAGGMVKAGNRIQLVYPVKPYLPLERV